MKSLLTLVFALISAPFVAFALLAPLHAQTWNTDDNPGAARIVGDGSAAKPVLKIRRKAKPLPKIVVISPTASPQGGNAGGPSAPTAGTEANTEKS
jgi:hypothetical protein